MSTLAKIPLLGRLFRETAKEDINGAFVPDDPRYQRFFAAYLGLFYQIDRMARARGGMLVDRPIDERMVFIARGLMKYNPYAQGIINGLRTYTLGCHGLRQRVTGHKELTKLAQKYIDTFKDQVDWWKWEREFYERVHIEGEAFIRFYPTGDNVDIRPIEPEWIIAPNGEEEWTFGCRNTPGDVHNITAYSVWYGAEQEVVEASEVLHIKSKTLPRCLKRGLSDFQSTCQLLDDSFKVWRNFLQSEAVRQSIIYFSKQAEGVGLDDIDAAVASQATYSPPIASGKLLPPTQLKQGSGVEYLTNGTELNSVPTAEGIQGVVAGVSSAMLAAGRPYAMPLWMITGDQNQNNVVDLGHESPFGAAIQDEQTWYSREQRQLFWRVLQIGVGEGHLPQEVLEKCDIAVESEARPPRDIKDHSERLKTLADDGIISRRTRATQEGFDYDDEQAQRVRDGDSEMGPEPEKVANNEDSY